MPQGYSDLFSRLFYTHWGLIAFPFPFWLSSVLSSNLRNLYHYGLRAASCQASVYCACVIIYWPSVCLMCLRPDLYFQLMWIYTLVLFNLPLPGSHTWLHSHRTDFSLFDHIRLSKFRALSYSRPSNCRAREVGIKLLDTMIWKLTLFIILYLCNRILHISLHLKSLLISRGSNTI